MPVFSSRPLVMPVVPGTTLKTGNPVPPDQMPFNPPAVIDMGSSAFPGQAVPWYSLDDGSASETGPDMNYINCSDARHL
jgi:hypothetical protein